MVVAEGLAALNSLKSLYEIAKEVRNSSDPEKLRAAAGQMFDLAFGAREQVALLADQRNAAMEELAALKGEIEKANRFDDEAKNYTREITHTGATVYREKDSAGPEGQSPYYCPTCFGHKEFRIMNPAAGSNTRIYQCTYVCGKCKTAMPLYVLHPPQQ